MDINQEIKNLWASSNLDRRVPVFYPDLRKSCNCDVIFVGLNPSFSTNGFTGILKNTQYAHVLNDIEGHFEYGKTKLTPQDLINIEQIAHSGYPYYKTFNELGKELKSEYCSELNKPLCTKHLDLLFTRETSQKIVEIQARVNPAYAKFINAQIDISIKYILGHNPKMIVICNAYASGLFRKRYGSSLTYLPNVGAEEFKYNGKSTIVLYSGMLSGQRSLDNGSFARLKWHIKYILRTQLNLKTCP